MKTLLKKISLFACIVLVASCGEDNLDPTGNWQITEATPMLPADNTAVVLDEDAPATVTRFEWNAAETSNKFVIQYKIVLVPENSEDYSNPLLSLVPGNSGKNLFLETTAEEIDYALWAACYQAGAQVDLKWAVISWAIDKQTVRSEEHTSELQSQSNLVCRLLLEKKKIKLLGELVLELLSYFTTLSAPLSRYLSSEPKSDLQSTPHHVSRHHLDIPYDNLYQIHHN